MKMTRDRVKAIADGVELSSKGSVVSEIIGEAIGSNDQRIAVRPAEAEAARR